MTRLRALQLVVLTAVYIAAGKLGLHLAFVNASTTAVWPATGIAMAALLLLGRELWPAVLVGAFVVNLTTAGTVATSLGIAAGNTLEAVVAALLVERYAGGRRAFTHPRGIFTFFLLAAGVSTALSATVGVTTLLVGGMARRSEFWRIWLTWWLGDAGGAVVVSPVLLLWGGNLKVGWRSRALPEGVLALVAALVVGQLVFGGLLPPPSRDVPLEFLSMPVCIWAAFRLGRRMSALTVATVYALAVRGTLHGLGPFARGGVNESLLLLQVFAGVLSVTTLVLAAVVAERRKHEDTLRRLAVSDPLTGLSNYRYLIDALEREIQRSQRTARPFAVVFLDLDGLKRINDRHGHLVGSRALWRVAEVLRRTVRAIDTAARYGGDEFALILPDADGTDAARVSARIAELLAADREKPPLSVSSGVALYPDDGVSVALLLGAADRAQYRAKALRGVPQGGLARN